MVFEKNHMSSINKVLSSVLPFDNLLIASYWLDAIIPISLILLLIFLLINYKKIVKIIDSNIIKGHLSIFVIACIFVVCPLVWLILPSIFINIQFAWRNCAYIVFQFMFYQH